MTLTRTPYCTKIRYSITGAPTLDESEMDGSHAPGVGVQPTSIELVYSAARDGKAASVSASVTGDWMRFGKPDGGQVTTHFPGSPDGWPVWLAEEARLHDPATPASVVRPELRDQIAEAVIPLLLDTLPKVIARARGYEIADVLLAAALPATTNRAAVLREAATIVRSMDSDYALQEAAEHLDGLAVEADEERETQAHLDALVPIAEGAPLPDGDDPSLYEKLTAMFSGPLPWPPPDSRPDLATFRERIAEDLYAHDHPGWLVPLRESDTEPVYRERAGAVLDGLRQLVAMAQPPTLPAAESARRYRYAAAIRRWWDADDGGAEEIAAAVMDVANGESAGLRIEVARLNRRIRDLAQPAVVAAAAGEEPADETVHGCPPDGSGLTPCCGRTPFELPRTDRISSEAPITCTGPSAAVSQPGKEN